jgi:hypothetical protein
MRKLSALRSFCIAALLLLFPQAAVASLWGPTFDDSKAGNYCKTAGASKGSKRGDRDGPIVLKVLSEGIRVRLSIKHTFYRPGTVAYARTENIGTETVADFQQYRIEKWTGADWRWIGPKGGWPLTPAPRLSGGRGRCFSFGIPSSAAPGRYRILKSLGNWPEGSREPDLGSLTREFVVRSRSYKLKTSEARQGE